MTTPLTEPFGVTDTFVTGIGRVEALALNLFRVTFYVDGKAAYDGTPERQVVDKLIMTADTMAAIAKQFAAGGEAEMVTAERRGDRAIN